MMIWPVAVVVSALSLRENPSSLSYFPKTPSGRETILESA